MAQEVINHYGTVIPLAICMLVLLLCVITALIVTEDGRF